MSLPHNHHPVLIVPAADRVRANEAMEALSGRVADLATFDQGPLSADGHWPASHYLAAPPLQEADYLTVVALWESDFPNGRCVDSDHDAVFETLEALLLELGLRRIEE